MIVAKLELDKLPEKCIYCPYHKFEENSIVSFKWDGVCIINNFIVNYKKNRPDWCPLIEIK